MYHLKKRQVIWYLLINITVLSTGFYLFIEYNLHINTITLTFV